MTEGHIKNLPSAQYPGWQKAIMLALSKYGAYVVDTCGMPGCWGFKFEGGTTYTSFVDGLSERYVDPLFEFAGSILGIGSTDWNLNYPCSNPFVGGLSGCGGTGDERFMMLDNIDWTRLQVLEPAE